MESFELWLRKYENQFVTRISKVLIWSFLMMTTALAMRFYANLDAADCLFTVTALHVLYLPIAASNYKILRSETHAGFVCTCLGEAIFLGFFLCGLSYDSELSEIFHNAGWAALELTAAPMAGKSKYARFIKLQPLLLWFLSRLYRNQTINFSEIGPYLALAFSLCSILFAQSNCMKVLKRVYRSHEKAKFDGDRFKRIIEELSDSIIIIRKDWEISFINESARALSGASDPASVKNFLRGLKYCENSREYTEGVNICNDIFSDIFHFSKREGQRNAIFGLISTSGRLYQWSGSKFYWHNIPYIILSARDITSILTLEHFKAENKYKTAMLRVVSHELRTPSIAIMSFTEQAMAEEDSLLSKTKCKLHMVKVCSKMILNLIHSFLDYSQIITGTFSLSKKSFSISEILNECYLMIKTQCEQKKIGLKLMIDPRLPILGFNDSNRISQVLTNLLMNAIKYTISGRITVEAHYTDFKQLLITVKDTGIGLDQASLSSLFRIFEDSYEDCPSHQGSGLGLHISSLIVPQLGGEKIQVVSTLNRGSEFSFLVDIFQEPPEIDEDYEDWNESICLERSMIHSMPSLQATPSISISDRKAEVLVVDDNDFNRAVVSELLDEAGLSYHEACTGLQAVEKVLKFNKGEEGYKVVLMDCEMPVMNGWEATKSIIQMWEEAKIEVLPAIIGYTAYSGSAEVKRCQEAGMICYLNKPVPKKELIETIKKYLV